MDQKCQFRWPLKGYLLKVAALLSLVLVFWLCCTTSHQCLVDYYWYFADRLREPYDVKAFTCKVLRSGIETNCKDGACSGNLLRHARSFENTECPDPVVENREKVAAPGRQLGLCTCYYIPWALVRGPEGNNQCAYMNGRDSGKLSSQSKAQEFLERAFQNTTTTCYVSASSITLTDDARQGWPGSVAYFIFLVLVSCCSFCLVCTLSCEPLLLDMSREGCCWFFTGRAL